MAEQQRAVSNNCFVNNLTEEMIFQGVPYLYCENQTIVRLIAELYEAVDGKTLQAALNDVMNSADYFRICFEKEADKEKITYNHQPCTVCNGNTQRRIPCETSGYLFYVSYEQRNIYFTWDHFIADGRSGIRFMNELLKAYCNRRYGAQLPQKELHSDSLFSLEELFAHYRRQRGIKRKTSIQEIESRLFSTSLIQARKEDLIRYAAQNGVKPFTALMYLIGRVVWQKKENEEYCSFSFTVDMRKALERPDALYNCFAFYNKEIRFQSGTLMMQEMDEKVKESLHKEAMLSRMAEFEKSFYDLQHLNVSEETKRRVFYMLQRTAISDYMLSYLGNPLSAEEKGLEQYVRDYYLRPLSCDIIPVTVEEVSFGNHISLCCVEKINNKDIVKEIAQELEKAGIQVQSVQIL